MLEAAVSKLKKGNLEIGAFGFNWQFYQNKGLDNARQTSEIKDFDGLQKLHLGPGPNWEKPSDDWLTVDINPDGTDIVLDFNDFNGFPLPDESVECIYGSHVFEHIDIFNAPSVFKDCCRVLAPGGTFRLVLPDVEKSIHEYVSGNGEYELFQRRMERSNDVQLTLFEALKEDFLSSSRQELLLGNEELAHQNAWDFEAISAELSRAGFDRNTVEEMEFQESRCSYFSFEGRYDAEANEDYRSLYVEVQK